MPACAPACLPSCLRVCSILAPNNSLHFYLCCVLQEGVGRRVGEQSEWLWSRCKPVFMLTRYMSQARWWDTINSCLALLSKLLQHELPAVLEKRLKSIDTCIGEAWRCSWQLYYVLAPALVAAAARKV